MSDNSASNCPYPSIQTAKLGAIYFIQCNDTGPIKIGITQGAFQSRMKSLQASCPYDLYLRAAFVGAWSDESALKKRFRNHAIRSEWFKPDPELLAHIQSVPAIEDWEKFDSERYNLDLAQAFRSRHADWKRDGDFLRDVERLATQAGVAIPIQNNFYMDYWIEKWLSKKACPPRRLCERALEIADWLQKNPYERANENPEIAKR